MTEKTTAPVAEVLPMPNATPGELRRQVRLLAVYLVVLTGCFSVPLVRLLRYAAHDEFFSYIPLIPIIALYLVWIKKAKVPQPDGRGWKGAFVAGACGAAVTAVCLGAMAMGWHPLLQDYLTLMTSAFLLFAVAGCFFYLGREVVKRIAFPLVFLVFMIPLPAAVLDRTISFFQISSAVTASAMLKLTGMPVFRSHLELDLPGFALWVAPECSGIHSTMVLLITAALAGYLFLRSGWKRALLIVFIVPLAIARNGFRIFVLGELCVRISHDIINSWIHHRGGPLFFVLSLVPFFYLLKWLYRSENPRPAATLQPPTAREVQL